MGYVRTLWVGGSEATLGAPQRGAGGRCRWQVVPSGAFAGQALRGVPARSRAGSRLSLEKARTQRVAGGGPRPPGLWPARSHSLVLAWWGALGRWWGYYGAHLRALIWGLSFAKNAFQHIFSRKCVPNRFWHTGGNSPSAVSETTPPKTSERQKRAIKPGVQGLAPALSPHFREKWGPAGQAGNGAPRPEAGKSPDRP